MHPHGNCPWHKQTGQGRPMKRWEDDIMAAGTNFQLAYINAQDENTWAGLRAEFVHRANVLWDTM